LAWAATQNYQLNGTQPENGMLVSLTNASPVIEPADTGNASSLLGVITPDTQNSPAPGNTNVQVSGQTNALVSTLNGTVRVGDRITVSSLRGVGARLTGDGWMVGVAQGSLNTQTPGAITTQVADSAGRQHTVAVGLVPVIVTVSYYGNAAANANATSGVLGNLQQLANTLGGKSVSLRTLIFGISLLLAGIIAAVLITVTAVRTGFTAIARQPLSKRTILREEWRSFALAFMILLVAFAASTLLFKFL
jgi:hypothetical protein